MVGTWSPVRVQLVTLAGSGASVVAREDVRGFDVRDGSNASVGVVDDLVIDADAGRVRMIKVGHGGVFGIGRDHRLVPVDVVESVGGGTVFLNVKKGQVDSAPVWGDITGEAFMTELYGHYGGQPYWSESYHEPDWTRTE